MANITRVVHRVRCRKKDNKQIWADVKVVDAVTVIEPGGQEKLFWVKDNVTPCIVDDTKAVPSFAKGKRDNCTRLSHMELATAQDDPSQKMYVEILDGVAFDWGRNPRLDFQHSQPADVAKTLDNGPYALIFPERNARKLVVDKVGLELGSGSKSDCSRAGHVNLVTEKGNTDDKTDAADEIPPQKVAWVATVKTDAINFDIPGGNICLIDSRDLQTELDRTKMTTDPDTGEPCPPDNTDPNVYVSFPQDGAGDPNAPCVGCNLKIPTRPGGGAIDQGPLWWIERISSGAFNPWFWFAKVQEPQAFSFFGNPGRLGSWAYRGFMLFNYYPVIWILSRNNPLVPMGSFGSPSLDLCARLGNWDFDFPAVPSNPAFVPARPAGVSFPFSGLSFSGPIIHEAARTYAPFGCLQMTHPPLGSPPDGVPYGNSLAGNNGSEIWSQKPNIFQLTGLPQPPRQDMTKAWDAFTNPILPPSKADARTAALRFRDNWNTVADGHNFFIQSYVGGGKTGIYSTPPGWNWAVPYFAPTVLGLKYYGSFLNGVPSGVATNLGLPLVDFIPATAWTMDVDQLDPKVWDTTKLEIFSNPINWFLPAVNPPLLR